MKYLDLDFNVYKEDLVTGRFVSNEDIETFLKKPKLVKTFELLGCSVENRNVYGIRLGKGQIKILIWSQMHGNESTTTKGLLDFINFLLGDDLRAKNYLENVTLLILPLLNPDGAEKYTRVNANGIDLNRDAIDLSQPESVIIREAYNNFKPDFCFNLHDQRTIFSAGTGKYPATISFLTPAYNKACEVDSSREKSMKLIACLHKTLSNLIPKQIGRYDDAYNPNCLGDTFQSLGTPTVLFEAGHYPKDYEREITRSLISYALFEALDVITTNKFEKVRVEDYFKIPENKKLYFDVLIKNTSCISSKYMDEIGVLYKEVLVKDRITFVPKVEKEGNLKEYYGHKELDCLNAKDLKILKNDSDLWGLIF
ncbi:M14 family metallopeptidase [Eudoraea sp.]|uniref:M14 family metallopeptidase n=2 Tax=Eudoraea sp. TaxID=1979955 RepID=UPI003C785A1D